MFFCLGGSNLFLILLEYGKSFLRHVEKNLVVAYNVEGTLRSKMRRRRNRALRRGKLRIGICVLLLMGLTIGDGRATAQSQTPGVNTSVFGKTKDGREAHLYTLSNKSGMQVVISDFGG